jgi:hydroxymethylbilane synthase
MLLNRLSESHPELVWELVEVPESGDDDALFELLAAGGFDLHVCAARALTMGLPDEVELIACTERNDPFDVLISSEGALLEDLPEGAAVGVESARVAIQIADFRDDLTIKKLGTSVDRLVEDWKRGDLAGFIVAAEDVQVLGWEDAVSEVFPPDILLPGAGQGAFAFVARKSDADAKARLEVVDHWTTRQVVLAERAFLRELDVKLTDPVAVHGSFDSDTLVLEALLGDEISGAILRDDLDGEPSEGADLGVRLAKLFVADGARDYLAGYK